MSKEHRELSAKEVCFRMDLDTVVKLHESPEIRGIIGQPRALKALKMATGIQAKGYNIFVTGMSGTGRRTAINHILNDYNLKKEKLKDIAVVLDFKDNQKPDILYFPAGKAVSFKKDLHQLLENLKNIIQVELGSESFKKKKNHLISQTEQHENHVIAEFEKKLIADNFRIIQIEDEEANQATDIIPIYNDEATDFDTLQALVQSGDIDEEYWNSARKKYYQHIDEMKQIFEDLRFQRDEMEGEIDEVQKKLVEPAINRETEFLSKKYEEKETTDYVTSLKMDIIENLYLFSDKENYDDESKDPISVRYGVNIIVDNSETEKVPVIFENHPTYSNLFGTIESSIEPNGEARTNFMMVRAGSLIQATGGFIILQAKDLLKEEEAWNALKRALDNGMVEIQMTPAAYPIPGMSLKPKPVKIDTKVIVVGPEGLYDFLYNNDMLFQKLFKVPAEFDSEMIRDDRTIQEYIQFMKMITADEGLKSLTVDGMGAIIEYGVRLCERKDRLSTRFSKVADLIRESDYWASNLEKEEIDRESVKKAITERNYLSSLPEEKIDEQILSGKLLFDLDGECVGEVNGLAILDRGYYSFGRPMRITAQVNPGEEGIINIEREAGLSAEIHDKGILIIEGFLHDRFAKDFPLSVYASVCFEQSYTLVDGDSASSTEIYALLSAISGIPLRQCIAVTGSVNQLGEIQPVGGISEKVEGFFTVCKKHKLSGKQGVMIPEQNINNLLLTSEVTQAIEDGMFHIYPVKTIEEGMELLTGREFGFIDENGNYPEGTISNLVVKRLKEMAAQVKKYAR